MELSSEALNGITQDDIVFVERLEDVLQCPQNFVVIDGQGACHVTFADRLLKVNLKSENCISIKEIPIDESVSTCPEVNEPSSSSSTPVCASLIGYDNVTMCAFEYSEFSDSEGKCQFTFPDNCRVSIRDHNWKTGNNEASLQCQDPNVPEDQTVLLLFPVSVYEMYELSFRYEGEFTLFNYTVSNQIWVDEEFFEDNDFQHLNSLYLEGCQNTYLDRYFFEYLPNIKHLALSFNQYGVSEFDELHLIATWFV